MREPRRDHYRSPAVGEDTETVLDAAIDSLAQLRGLGGPDAAAGLHLLASLAAETARRLPAAVTDARGQGCSWAQIADLLGVTRAAAQQRYGRPATSDNRHR
jgi:hypothetical protein